MCTALLFFTGFMWLFTLSKPENPSYDQGVYKPEFLNYCYEDRKECSDVCGCMLDRKCMVRPIHSNVMKSILERHNNVRKDRLKSDPKASGMPRLEYDAQLEAIAQCWAAKCRHDTTDCLLTESYPRVGMNVGMIKIEEMNSSPFLESPYSDTKPLEELWRNILDTWVKEIDTIQVLQPYSKNESEICRGAQLIHDQTLAVGCSWSASPEGSFFFCVYGPGIQDNTTIYKSGPPCSSCPPGLKCTDESEGMCVKYSIYPDVKFSTNRPSQGDYHEGGTMAPPSAPEPIRSNSKSVISRFEIIVLLNFLALIMSCA